MVHRGCTVSQRYTYRFCDIVNRVQPREGPQIGICNGGPELKVSRRYWKDIYRISSPPWAWAVGSGGRGVHTQGAGPFRIVSYSNSCAANLWHGFIDMLHSCGHALSQGDGSVFHPRGDWEATPPDYIVCLRAWRRLAPCHGAIPAQTYYGSPVKLEEYGNAGRYNWL